MSIPFSAASFLASGLAMTTPVGGAAVGALGTDGAATTGAWILGGAEGAAGGAGGAAGLEAGGAAAVKSLKAATSSLVGTMTHSAYNDITTARQ